jgi:spore germination protein YaaH
MTTAFTLATAQESSDLPGIHYRHSRTVAVWLPYWMDKNGDGAGWKDVAEHVDQLDEVSFFAFSADPNTGDLTNDGLDHGLAPDTIIKQVAWLHASDVAAIFTVAQFNHVGQMLSDTTRLDHLVDMIVKTSTRYGFDGVDIDFEDFKPGDPADMTRFTDFIEQLSLAMHAQKDSFEFPRTVIATVLPRTTRGTFGYIDYDALGKSDVDRIRVMAYDENYTGSKHAGASAPVPWVASVAGYLSSVNAPQWKFLLGVPAYGYRWPVVSATDWTTTGTGFSVTYGAAKSLMTEHNATRMWSDDQRAPYFNYIVNGQAWIAFYEDAESWQTKLQTVLLPSRMNGISAWAAGFEDPSSWPVIDANLATSDPIYGVVGACYWRYGGGARLGSPLSAEQDSGVAEVGTLNERAGREQDFENGNIYYQWNCPRAYVVDGTILASYVASGRSSGKYGFPTGDAVTATDGTVSQQFEHGVITQ